MIFRSRFGLPQWIGWCRHSLPWLIIITQKARGPLQAVGSWGDGLMVKDINTQWMICLLLLLFRHWALSCTCSMLRRYFSEKISKLYITPLNSLGYPHLMWGQNNIKFFGLWNSGQCLQRKVSAYVLSPDTCMFSRRRMLGALPFWFVARRRQKSTFSTQIRKEAVKLL